MASVQHLLFPLAQRFVAGESADEAIAAVRRLNADGLDATIDMLGEDVTEDAAATRVRDGYRALIERVAAAGIRTNLSLKLSALGLSINRDRARANFLAVLDAAQALPDPFVRIDMEGSALLEPTLALFYDVFATHRNCGTVLQAYLHRTPADVARMNALCARVRLCKGAYREPPSIAIQDAQALRERYRSLAGELLLHGTYPAIATHDETLIAAAAATAAEHGVAASAFEFQLLYGVRPEVQHRLVAAGYRVRVYVPFGSHWARYFRRRVMERRANLLFALRSLVRT